MRKLRYRKVKFLLDVTPLVSSRAGTCNIPIKENGEASSCMSLHLLIAFIPMVETPTVPVTEQVLYLCHLMSPLQMRHKVGSMALSLPKAGKPT